MNLIMNQLIKVSFVLVFVWFGSTTQTNLKANPDLITNLPGLNDKTNFRQYSGYLDALHGASLHYWLFESQNDPSKDPVVFWFNGGPLVSSLIGAFTEQGPFRINSQEQLELNNFAWNQRANMIFLESPAGVGYSIKKDQNYATDDKQTIDNNYAAIESFFKKYPHLAENDFYVTGESYAGIYVPMIGISCLANGFPKNFKGIAIGNPILDWELNENSKYHYYYHHALIDDIDWKNINSICCPNETNYFNCNYVKQEMNSRKCREVLSKAVMKIEVKSYNIYSDALGLPSLMSLVMEKQFLWTFDPKKKSIQSMKQVFRKRYSDSISMMTTWLNRADVRKALHIDPRAGKWSWVSDFPYETNYLTMKPQIKYLLNHGRKVLIYHGDFDSVCNYLGGRWFVEDLGYNATSDYQKWDFNQRLAGFQIKYGNNLTFKTVMAAGHMVPMDQPGPALKLFNDFLSS